MSDHKPDNLQPANHTARFRPIIRVFVSSTFTDLKRERDALQQKVFPKLEQLCASRQFQFQAIDLRWGVPTEANLDHRTMHICFEELRRSQEISPQPNFLVLLGNRYGWRPLPEEVFPDEFERLEQAVLSDDERKVLRTWYRRDDNAVPPVYVLQSRKQEAADSRDYTDEEAWREVERVLWSIINRAYPGSLLAGRFDRTVARDEPLPAIVRFQASATEQEIWRGALGMSGAEKHVLVCVRELENTADFPRPVEIRDFLDVDESGAIDPGPQAALAELKQALKTRLGPAHFHEFRGARLTGKPAEVTTGHLDALCEQVLAGLRPIVERQMDEYWGKEAPEVRALELERDEHRRFGQERAPATAFVGREQHLRTIEDYLAKDSRKLLVIHGPSGCGKTALLARAAQAAEPGRKPIVRFIGVTPQSSDARALLAGLCRELRQEHQLPTPLPEDLDGLAREFTQHIYAATAKKQVALFLDALDQLADTGAGRYLQWLPAGELPAHAKIVVSCLDDRAPDDPTGEPYRALRAREMNAPDFLNLDALPEQDARALLFERWLPQAGRRLSADQQQHVERQIRADSCREPLYLRVLFEEARLWRSYDPVPGLAGDVSGLLDTLLKRLAEPRNHGRTVEAALGYIASARRGLGETEILEVLYRDPDYRRSLDESAARTGHSLPAQPERIPVAIWSRLRSDLAPYLAEQAAPGATVLNFYHRQVADCVWSLFLDLRVKQNRRHRRLADFYEQQATGLRRTDELPWQLAKSKSWRRLSRLLADADFFDTVWDIDKFSLETYWAQLIEKARVAPADIYSDFVDSPKRRPSMAFRVGVLLRDMGFWSRAIPLFEKLAAFYKSDGNMVKHVRCLGELGTMLHSRGERDRAIKLLRKQIHYARRLSDDVGLQAALGRLANLYYDEGRHKLALSLLDEQQAICERTGNTLGLQSALGDKALVFHDMGKFTEALALHKQEIEICRVLGDQIELATALGNQALVLNDLDDPTGAMALHKEEEYLYRKLGCKDGLAVSMGNQALILADWGNLAEAMKLHKEEEKLCTELGDRHGVAFSLGHQALILAAWGKLKRAMKLHKEEERMARELRDWDGLQGSLGNQGKLLQTMGELDEAMKLHKEEARICRRFRNPLGLCYSLGNQARILREQGDHVGAMRVHNQEERLCRRLGCKDALQSCLGNMALVWRDKGQPDKARVLHKQEEKLCRELNQAEGLVQSLMNQADLLFEDLGLAQEALPLVQEAHRVASRHGYALLEKKAKAMLRSICTRLENGVRSCKTP